MKRIFLLIPLLFFTMVASAQIGSLKKTLNKAKPKKKIDLGLENQKFLPAVRLSSLLDVNGVRLSLDGTFSINTLEMSFLPKTDTKGEQVNYNPYASSPDVFLIQGKLFKKGTEKELHTFCFSVNPVMSPFSTMTTIHNPNKGIEDNVKIQEGSYDLKFYVADVHVHSFPFEVKKKENNDPYAAFSTLYFMDGPWSTYGRITFTKSINGIQPFFEFYALNATTDVENEFQADKQKEIKYTWQVYCNGKLLAYNDINTDGKNVKSLMNGRRGIWGIAGDNWARTPLPRSSTDHYIRQEELKDGDYRIDLSRGNFEGGTIKETYRFKIKNGKPVPLPQANRATHKDKSTLIEQGPNDHFILKS